MTTSATPDAAAPAPTTSTDDRLPPGVGLVIGACISLADSIEQPDTDTQPDIEPVGQREWVA